MDHTDKQADQARKRLFLSMKESAKLAHLAALEFADEMIGSSNNQRARARATTKVRGYQQRRAGTSSTSAAGTSLSGRGRGRGRASDETDPTSSRGDDGEEEEREDDNKTRQFYDYLDFARESTENQLGEGHTVRLAREIRKRSLEDASRDVATRTLWMAAIGLERIYKDEDNQESSSSSSEKEEGSSSSEPEPFQSPSELSDTSVSPSSSTKDSHAHQAAFKILSSNPPAHLQPPYIDFDPSSSSPESISPTSSAFHVPTPCLSTEVLKPKRLFAPLLPAATKRISHLTNALPSSSSLSPQSSGFESPCSSNGYTETKKRARRVDQGEGNRKKAKMSTSTKEFMEDGGIKPYWLKERAETGLEFTDGSPEFPASPLTLGNSLRMEDLRSEREKDQVVLKSGGEEVEKTLLGLSGGGEGTKRTGKAKKGKGKKKEKEVARGNSNLKNLVELPYFEAREDKVGRKKGKKGGANTKGRKIKNTGGR